MQKDFIKLFALFKSAFRKARFFLPIINIVGLFVGLAIFIIIPLFYPYMEIFKFYKVIWKFGSFVYISLLVYIPLYKWRKLKLSLLSFILFTVNLIFFSLYVLGLLNLLHGFPKPIYVENLSEFAFYRYFILLILSFIGLMVLIGFRNKTDRISILSYPYFKEEIFSLLKTWEDTFWGPLWSRFMDLIVRSLKYQVIFYGLYLTLNYIVPLIQATLLLNVALFHGDLRFNIYLLPLSFIAWVFRFFEFYFLKFVQENSFACREQLIVKHLRDLPITEDAWYYTVRFKDLHFSLSQIAIDQGADERILPGLIELWVTCAEFEIIYNKYKSKLIFLSYLTFMIRLLAWSLLTYTLYHIFRDDSHLVGETIVSMMTKVTQMSVRPYATQSFRLKQLYQGALEKKSGGDYKGPHPVTTDTDLVNAKNEVPLINQPTHDPGPVNNPSKTVSWTEDLLGQARAQHAVYPRELVTFPKTWLDKPLPNSEDYWKKKEIAENHAKNSKNEE
jgi:hypothetical protein